MGGALNSEQLHYFELAYEERNFSAAARRVPVSPQGLSKAIRALEKELDVPLFEMDDLSGLPVPTAYAEELIEFTAVSRSNMRLLKEAFARIRGQEKSRIRLGCSLGVMGVFGPQFLSGFTASHPNVDLQYWEMNDALCDDGLRTGVYDVALAVAPYDTRFEVQELYRCPIYFWVRSDDPLARKESLSIGDFAGRDLAIPGEGFKCHDRLRRTAAAHGVELGTVFQMSEIFQLYEFAASGRGPGFSVRHLVELPIFSRSDDVVAVPMEGSGWGFGIQHLATHALGDAERSFWNWCTMYARRLPSDPLLPCAAPDRA